MTVIPTITGPVLVGKRLFDTRTRQAVVEKWMSVHAEFIAEKDSTTLFYFYKIWRKDGSEQCDKVGYVIAKEGDDGTYVGRFADISVAQQFGEVLRTGEVCLAKKSDLT